MALLRNFGKIVLICVTGAILNGCMKDVDFSQAREFNLNPDLEADLLTYEVDEKQFFDPETKEFNPIIRDTVRLEFLDDDYIQNDLQEVEFFFRHTNTFSQAFRSRIQFLSNANRKQLTINYEVAPGSPENPRETSHTEFVEEDQIHLVRNSIQMVVELEAIPDGGDFEGELDFASTGRFMFLFEF